MAKTDDAIRVTKSGVTLNVTSSPLTPTLLPTNEAGEFPRAVRLAVDTGVAYVKVGVPASGTNSAYLTPTLSDLLVTPNESVRLQTRGQCYINALTRAGTLNLNVIPIEE
jgi:hypothetical protein